MINCNECRHYYITWDKDFPHGCKAMGFKSEQRPSAEVRVSSGRDCLLFQKKTPVKRKKTPQE